MAIFPTIRFLQDNEQLVTEGLTTRRVVNGPGRVIVPAFYRAHKRTATTLSSTEYAHIKNTLTGDIRIEIGPKLVFLDAY